MEANTQNMFNAKKRSKKCWIEPPGRSNLKLNQIGLVLSNLILGIGSKKSLVRRYSYLKKKKDPSTNSWLNVEAFLFSIAVSAP